MLALVSNVDLACMQSLDLSQKAAVHRSSSFFLIFVSAMYSGRITCVKLRASHRRNPNKSCATLRSHFVSAGETSLLAEQTKRKKNAHLDCSQVNPHFLLLLSHFTSSVALATTLLLVFSTPVQLSLKIILILSIPRSSGQHLNQARAVVLPLPNFHRAVIFAKTLYLGVAIHGLFMIGQKMVKKE